jgi:transposase InsO family protein
LGLYPARIAANAIFSRTVVGRVTRPDSTDSDRRGEFFVRALENDLREARFKLRPIRPRAPHLNGKVERSQQADYRQFSATADLGAPTHADALAEWQTFYNWQRPHLASHGHAPMQRLAERLLATPCREDVFDAFEEDVEPERKRVYALDIQLRRLKQS